MNESIILLGLGFVIGVFLASGFWIILLVINKAEKQLKKEKHLVIKSITEESAEADKILSSDVSKTMSAHSLRSALMPKIEKIQKLITSNMHILDIYFVKYIESKIESYKASFEKEQVVDFTVDKYLRDSKTKIALAKEEIEDIKTKIEPQKQIEEPVTYAEAPKKVLEEKKKEEEPLKEQKVPIMPQTVSDIDLRTGIITVSPDVKEETPKVVTDNILLKESEPVALEKKTLESHDKILITEEEFDIEKISPSVRKVPEAKEIKQENIVVQDHTEKTMQWDKSELLQPTSETILVEGEEISKVKEEKKRAKKEQKIEESSIMSTSQAQEGETIISGEDIENTLDSFFGLGGKS